MPIDRFHILVKGTMVLVVVLLSSCRTYGGYGTEQATYDRIEAINASFSGDLAGARAQLPILQQASQGRADLRPFVQRYERLLERHAAMVDAHATLLATLRVKTGPLGRLTSSYRDLNRAFGAIVSEQKEMEMAYEEIALRVRKTVLGDAFTAEMPREIGRYEIAPPYYERIRYALERARLELDSVVTG